MNIPIRRSVLLVLLAGGVSSPVLADCCSSFWSCAATVATEGLSCELQTIIDTITSLVTEIKNFGDGITGITSDKEAAARQSVTDTINSMQSQSQQASSDLAAALSQVTTIYTQEKTPIGFQSVTHASENMQTTSPNSVSKPPQLQTVQTAREQTPNSGNPLSMTTQRTQGSVPVATPPSSGSPTLQKSTVNDGTQVANLSAPIAAPHGTYTDAFSRAQQQITLMKAAGDSDLPKVIGHMAQAQATEGPGVAAADTLAGVMRTPITAMGNELNELLTDPLKAFDPTSLVTDMENSVTAALNANTPQMIADITAGPDQAFAAAQPAYDDLLANAQRAQALATAVANLNQLRSPAAAQALYALLPTTQYADNTKAPLPAGTNVAARFGPRLSYASLAARSTATRQKALAVAKLPSDVKLRNLATQLKTLQAQGKAPLPQSALVSYKGNFSSQLNSYFNNKPPAAVATQRDQLIAQARTQFAKDPTTGNAVVALLNSEAAKRGTTVNSTATAAVKPIPGQPVPTLATQTASSFKPTAVTTPVPVNPPVSQTKAPTWGTAPAATTTAPSWGPAATAGAPGATTGMQSSFKATTTVKTAQPIQQQTQQATMPMAAPSSMGR